MTAQAGDTLNIQPAEKSELRRLARARRRALPLQQRRLAARQAARRLCDSSLLRGVRHLGVYLSVASELDTAPLLRRCRRLRLRLYAPSVNHRRQMRFLALRGTARRRDALGLPRALPNRPYRSVRRLDAILVPLLGFDTAGVRLGAGGGYYDRCCAFKKRAARPRLIGYAYAVQEWPALPAEPWDVRLDAVVTERRILRIRRASAR